jgi:hypothetical protein
MLFVAHRPSIDERTPEPIPIRKHSTEGNYNAPHNSNVESEGLDNVLKENSGDEEGKEKGREIVIKEACALDRGVGQHAQHIPSVQLYHAVAKG